MPLRISQEADEDFRAIYLIGADRFGVAAADRYAAALAHALAVIEDFPKIARAREEIDGKVRAYPVRSHLILYEVDEEGIHILRVRHGREDWLGDAP